MKMIYTGIDLGSDSIKIVVSELVNQKFQVLSSYTVRSVGIKKGMIVDPKMATSSLKLAVREIESMLGVKIDKAFVTVPSKNIEITICTGSIEIQGEEKEVTGEDVTRVLEAAIDGTIREGMELVTAVPISFTLDDKDKIKDPKGLLGSHLEVKVVVTSVPSKQLYDVLNIMNEAAVEVIDIAFSSTGDYYEAKTKDLDTQVGAIVNIGSETTTVSIFNKGIMIKNEVIDLGSKFVDNDIAYIYKIDRVTARKLKESFSVSSRQYADFNDIIEINGKDGEVLTINQAEISEIVEARLEEILKLAKRQINLLTNRQISYIIVTGGISELAGFQYMVETVLGRNATTLNITTMGIRNNKYSSVIGIIKYFKEKLELRGQEYSMFNDKKTIELVSTKKKMNLSNDTIISKVFGYFFDN